MTVSIHALVCALVLAAALGPSTSIKCFTCSKCRPGNGTLQTCPDFVPQDLNPKSPPLEDRFCLKATILKTSAVARGCGHTTAQFYGVRLVEGCHQHEVGGLVARYCRCDEDYCNGGERSGDAVLWPAIAAAIVGLVVLSNACVMPTCGAIFVALVALTSLPRGVDCVFSCYTCGNCSRRAAVGGGDWPTAQCSAAQVPPYCYTRVDFTTHQVTRGCGETRKVYKNGCHTDVDGENECHCGVRDCNGHEWDFGGRGRALNREDHDEVTQNVGLCAARREFSR